MLQGKKSIMKILKNTDSHTEMRVITLTCDTEEREEIIYRWHAIMAAISRPRQSAKARHLDKNSRKNKHIHKTSVSKKNSQTSRY